MKKLVVVFMFGLVVLAGCNTSDFDEITVDEENGYIEVIKLTDENNNQFSYQIEGDNADAIAMFRSRVELKLTTASFATNTNEIPFNNETDLLDEDIDEPRQPGVIRIIPVSPAISDSHSLQLINVEGAKNTIRGRTQSVRRDRIKVKNKKKGKKSIGLTLSWVENNNDNNDISARWTYRWSCCRNGSYKYLDTRNLSENSPSHGYTYKGRYLKVELTTMWGNWDYSTSGPTAWVDVKLDI